MILWARFAGPLAVALDSCSPEKQMKIAEDAEVFPSNIPRYPLRSCLVWNLKTVG